MRKVSVRTGEYPLINNGFTLIELLAVIVILAIIALIAVPIILNIINNSKESSVLVSGKNYVRALEQQILSKNIKEKFSPEICIIQEDGNLICDGDIPFTVEVSGSKPTSGEIKFNNKTITEVKDMILDGYVLEMEIDENLIVLGTTDILEPPLDPKGTYLAVNSSYVNNELSLFLNSTIKRKDIEIITVTYTNKVPSNAIGSWDASEAQDGSIIAWYTDKDNNNLYEVYIGGEGGVKANPNSSSLFEYCKNATKIDVKYLDTSEVTNMSKMFHGCSSINNLNLSNFDTQNVINMSQMFSSCINLLTIDVSSFDTSKVNNMSNMFSMNLNGDPDSKLTDIIGLTNFDTSQVTNMAGMFNGCKKIINLDLSNFETSNVTNMTLLFFKCENLEKINLKKSNFDNVTENLSMFTDTSKLTSITVKDADAQTFINARLAAANKTGVIVTIAA